MFAKRSTKVLVLLLLVGTALVVIMVPTVLGQNLFLSKNYGRTISIEVAENGTRFVPDETPVFEEDGYPAYGTEFITEGYIYPAGTLTCENNECNGVLENGEPEFPDEVIGKWICRGWHVGDGGHTETGPWVVSTQIFDFGDVPGANMIVTDGYEYSDFDLEFNRAITGGSGTYHKVRGDQDQIFLGWNPSFGAALTIDLHVKR